MSPAIRYLSVACLTLSVLVQVDCARRDRNPVTTQPEGDEARCVDISASLSSCRRLGYRQMRLPSLLNDTANTTLSVAAGVMDKCGEDGLVLVCSLLAPVCIDRPIYPCASLCHNVTAGCPAASTDVADLVNCSSLPSDDQLCIGPNLAGRKTPTDNVFDARLQRPRRKRLGTRAGRPAADDRRRRGWKRKRGSSSSSSSSSSRRTSKQPSTPTRRTRKWNSNNNRERKLTTAVSDTVNSTLTLTTLCSVCAEQLSRRAFNERLCSADFVARVNPSRYIRAGSSLKLLASKSTKYYKAPKSSTSSSSRRRAVFFLHGTSTAHCPCLQSTTDVVDSQVRRRRRGGGAARHDGGLLVVGQLDGGRRRTRLLVTAALPLSNQTLVRRAVRLARSTELCESRTPRTERDRSGSRRQRRPDRMLSDDVRQTARRDGRKRSRIQERVSDAAARRSRKRKPQRNRRNRRRQD